MRKNKRGEGKPFRRPGVALQGILLEKWKAAEKKKAKRLKRMR